MNVNKLSYFPRCSQVCQSQPTRAKSLDIGKLHSNSHTRSLIDLAVIVVALNISNIKIKPNQILCLAVIVRQKHCQYSFCLKFGNPNIV